NNTGALLDTIYFTLNPGLTVDAIFINDKPTTFNRDLQIIFLNDGIRIEPDQDVNIRINYHGTILESAAHLDVDQKRYEEAIDYFMFSVPKKYAFLEDDYVLLTKDVLWYPDTEVGYNREFASKKRQSF